MNLLQTCSEELRKMQEALEEDSDQTERPQLGSFGKLNMFRIVPRAQFLAS